MAKDPQDTDGKNGAERTSRASDPRQWNFPKNTLEEAIGVAQAIEEKYAGNPVKPDQLLKPLGFNKVADWRMQNLLRSAYLYGLTSGAGTKTTISLDQLGTDIVAPKGPEQRREALFKAFLNVDLFRRVYDYYKEKRIPEEEFFANTLVREFDVPRERVATFISVFTANAQFLKAFRVAEDGGPVLGRVVSELDSGRMRRQDGQTRLRRVEDNSEQADEGREFLDTCFIIMPFGEWYDRYYREIYMPATKEAGFEPVRADELFNTGSVIEQIWEQISKAKVLLAELTGKNANVFYELGLAHAVPKPVVFISGNLDDVPFDLRHLRVIIYDIRDPHWGEKLRKAITAYLKNARTDPAKSIPQPFRDMHEEPPDGGEDPDVVARGISSAAGTRRGDSE